MFSIRLVKADHYMNPPIPGLDVKFSEFRAVDVKQVPVIRIFGSTTTGQKVCLHVHGVFPYIYIPYDGIVDRDRYVYQVASALDKALNVSLGNSNSCTQHVYKISIVSAVPFYGYHSKCHQFLKIYFYNPLMVKRATDLLQNGAVLGQTFQPHEAHIPYILQFFIDYNLHGMNYVHLASVRYRQGTVNGASDTSPLENVPKNLLLPENITRISTCKLEVDAVATDILNHHEILGQITGNPGLKAIWDEEIERRRVELRSSQITPQNSQTRQPCLSTDSEIFHLERLNKNLKDFTSLALKVESHSSGNKRRPYPAETPEDQCLMEASFLPSHVPSLGAVAQDDYMVLASTASMEESTAHVEKPLIDINVAQSLVHDSSQCLSEETTTSSQCLSLVQVLQDLVEEDSVLGSQGLDTEETKSLKTGDVNNDVDEEDSNVFSQTIEERENPWEFDGTGDRTLKNTSPVIENEVCTYEDVNLCIPQLDGANDVQKNEDDQPQLDDSHRSLECKTNSSPSVPQSNTFDSETISGIVFEKNDNMKPETSLLEISDMGDTDSLQTEIFTDNFSIFPLNDPCNPSGSACPSPDPSGVGYTLDPVSGKTFLESVLIGDPSFTAQPNLSEKDELLGLGPAPPLDEPWGIEGGSGMWLGSEKCFSENTRNHLSEIEEELCNYGTNELNDLSSEKNIIVHSELNISPGLSKTAMETKRRLSSLIKSRSKHSDTTENSKIDNEDTNVSGGIRSISDTSIFGSIDTLTPILQGDELENLLNDSCQSIGPNVLMNNDDSVLNVHDSSNTLPQNRSGSDHKQDNQDCADENKGLNDDSSLNNVTAETTPKNEVTLGTKRRFHKVKDRGLTTAKKDVRQNQRTDPADNGKAIKDIIPPRRQGRKRKHLKEEHATEIHPTISKNNGMGLEASVCAAHLTLNTKTVKEKLSIFVRKSLDRKLPSLDRKNDAVEQNEIKDFKSKEVTLPSEKSAIGARHDTEGEAKNIEKHPETVTGCMQAEYPQECNRVPREDNPVGTSAELRKPMPLEKNVHTEKNKEASGIGRFVRERLGIFVGSRKSKLNLETRLNSEQICNNSSTKTTDICDTTDNSNANSNKNKVNNLIKAERHTFCSGKMKMNENDTSMLINTSVPDKNILDYSLRPCYVRLEQCNIKSPAESKNVVLEETSRREEQLASCQLILQDSSAKSLNSSEKQVQMKAKKNVREQIDNKISSLNQQNSKPMFEVSETSAERLECGHRQDITSLEMKCVIPDSPKPIHKCTRRATKDIGGLKAVVQAESPRVADTLDTLAENPTQTIRHYAPSGSNFLESECMVSRTRNGSDTMTEHAEAKVPIVPYVQDCGNYTHKITLPLTPADVESSAYKIDKTSVTHSTNNNDSVVAELPDERYSEFLTYTRIKNHKRKPFSGVIADDTKTKKQKKSTLLLSQGETQVVKTTRISQPVINTEASDVAVIEASHQREELPLDAVANVTKHSIEGAKEVVDKKFSTDLNIQQQEEDCQASKQLSFSVSCNLKVAAEGGAEDIQRLSSVGKMNEKSSMQQATVALSQQKEEKQHKQVLPHNRGFPRIRLKSHKSFKRKKTHNNACIRVPLPHHRKERKESSSSRKEAVTVNKSVLGVRPQEHTCQPQPRDISRKKVSVEQDMTTHNSHAINVCKSQCEDITSKYNVVTCTKDVNTQKKKSAVKGKVPNVHLKSAKIVLHKLDENTVQKLIAAPHTLESGKLTGSSKRTKIEFMQKIRGKNILCVDGAVDSSDSDFSDDAQPSTFSMKNKLSDTSHQDSILINKFVGAPVNELVHKEKNRVCRNSPCRHPNKLMYKPLVIKKCPSKKSEESKLEAVKVHNMRRTFSKESSSNMKLKDSLAVYLGSVLNKPVTDCEIHKFLPVVLIKSLTPNILKLYRVPCVDFTKYTNQTKRKGEKSSQCFPASGRLLFERAERKKQNSVDNCNNEHCGNGSESDASAVEVCTACHLNPSSGMKCESGTEHLCFSALSVVTKRKSRICQKV